MEKFMLRENGVLGYSLSQPKTPNGSSEDMDFNDVFGGPPRRFSIQDVKLRYSFGDAVESDEEIVSSALNEKPVFGEDGVPRRRHHQGDDFFDDIFKGEESYNSPRRATADRDSAFGSSPGSRILSPAKPFPPQGTSVPAQFSLPAKLTKGLEIPTFAANGQNKMDVSANGLSSPQSSIPLNRFLSQVIQGQDEIPVYRQSPLSRGVSLRGEDMLPTLTSDHKENVDHKKKDRRNVDGIGEKFHFSIYKWAGREVPMLLPLLGRDKAKARDGYDRSASSNGRIESKLSGRVGKSRGLSAAGSEALKVEPKKGDLSSQEEVQDHMVVLGGARQNMKERGKSMDDIDVQAKDEREVPPRRGESGQFENTDVQEKTEKQVPLKKQETEKQVPLKKQDSLRFEIKALHTFLRDEIDSPKRTEEKFPVNKEESLQFESKPLQAFLGSGMESPGNIADRKGNKKRIPNGTHSNSQDFKTVNGNERTRVPSNNGIVAGPNLQGAATVDSGTSHGEDGVKGKVREFVQIFNQDGDSRPKDNLQRRSKSSRWKAVDADPKENGMSTNAAEVKEKVNLHNVAKKPDDSVKVDENLNKNEAQQNSPTKATSHTTQRSSTNQKNGFASEKFRRDSRIYIENFDDLLEDDFLVQELPDDHETVAESEDFDDTKAIDAKIRQWSSGKKGNIRSLLSTLQFVLWPESGWKPVPLADLIEMNSVKRAYQKALLRLHPDKLQQKGAAFHQKYTAEKVFDILQEAWDQFNTLVPLRV